MSTSCRTFGFRAAIAALALTPALASAAARNPLPEPGSWALVAVGLVAAIALSRKNRK